MTIDPALRGTTFAKALEAAARDEQAKREQRAAERNGAPPSVAGKARLIAEEIRRQARAPMPTDIDSRSTPIVDEANFKQTQVSRRETWVQQITDSQTPKKDTSIMTQEQTEPLQLSATQLSILEVGMTQKEFTLTRQQMGSRPNRLAEAGLIQRLPNGNYTLLQPGRVHYMMVKKGFAATEDLKADDNPSPMPSVSPDVEMAALKLQLKQVTGLANDRANRVGELQQEITRLKDQLQGRPTDDQTGEIDALKRTITSLEHQLAALNKDIDRTEYEMLRTTVFAIEAMMRDDDENLTLVEYVQQLRQGFLNETAIVNAINEMAALDGKGEMGPREYVEWLRERDIQNDTWWPIVVNPLIELIEAHTDGVRNEMMDDPARIVRWASTMRQSLAHMDSIADEHMALIEQKDGQIESLNRRIDELCENLNARQITPARAADIQLAAQILDELCEMVPEIEGYRTAREQAVKAIAILKARRS